MKKRRFLQGGLALAGAIAISRFLPSQASDTAISPEEGGEEENFEISKTPEEWQAILTPEEYAVLRLEKTERPFSSPLNKVHEKGIFSCAGCDLPLFSSEAKFNSGTGWPSFYAPLENAIATSIDRSLLMTRTEVHCRRCGGHLGHVFEDGPEPTGLRYCMNGVAMTFTPEESA
ncbi:MAG: peptide-methionine (R)-S-oxide reductase MsrB [Cyanobacteria bacterium J06649_4]